MASSGAADDQANARSTLHRAMAAVEPSQNPSAKSGRNSSHFEPGNKLGAGHKLGRPKGLARRVRESVEIAGGDQNTLVTIMVQHATGYRQMIHPTETDENQKAVETWEAVTVSEQQAAIRWLADRGYGKALEFVPIETDEELVSGPDIPGLASDFEKAIDELAAQRRKRITDQDAQDQAAEQ